MRKSWPAWIGFWLLLSGTLLLYSSPALTADDRPFIGVELGSVTRGGITIDRVMPDTAAERFGLEDGDIILRIDDVVTSSARLLRHALAEHRAGDKIEIEILRGGERLTIGLELGSRPNDLAMRREQADRVLEALQVRPGDDVADIGCGSGWLSEAIAAELDGSGKVYAIELEESHIESLRERNLPGIVPVLSRPDDVSLPPKSLDIALLHDVASHINQGARKGFYNSVRSALRPGGRLVIFGPHGDAKTMLKTLRDNGFEPMDGDVLGRLAEDDIDRRLAEGIIFLPAPSGAG